MQTWQCQHAESSRMFQGVCGWWYTLIDWCKYESYAPPKGEAFLDLYISPKSLNATQWAWPTCVTQNPGFSAYTQHSVIEWWSPAFSLAVRFPANDQYREGPWLLLAKVPDRIGRIGIFILIFSMDNQQNTVWPNISMVDQARQPSEIWDSRFWVLGYWFWISKSGSQNLKSHLSGGSGPPYISDMHNVRTTLVRFHHIWWQICVFITSVWLLI